MAPPSLLAKHSFSPVWDDFQGGAEAMVVDFIAYFRWEVEKGLFGGVNRVGTGSSAGRQSLLS